MVLLARSHPALTDFTRRVMNELPAAVRLSGGPTLEAYLGLVGDQISTALKIAERIDYIPPDEGGADDTSDLLDPKGADAAWLPWMAQLYGIPLDGTLTETQRRNLIADWRSRRHAGSKQSMIDAVRAILTRDQMVRVYDHATDTGPGGRWDVLVVTLKAETPNADGQLVLDAIRKANVKPAGVVLHHRFVTGTWAALKTARPTWADWNGDTWLDIEDTGYGS